METKKSGLSGAIDEALTKETEKERLIAVLDCVRGYKSEYDQETEKPQFDGFMKCKNEYRSQIEKIKDFVSKSDIIS